MNNRIQNILWTEIIRPQPFKMTDLIGQMVSVWLCEHPYCTDSHILLFLLLTNVLIVSRSGWKLLLNALNANGPDAWPSGQRRGSVVWVSRANAYGTNTTRLYVPILQTGAVVKQPVRGPPCLTVFDAQFGPAFKMFLVVLWSASTASTTGTSGLDSASGLRRVQVLKPPASVLRVSFLSTSIYTLGPFFGHSSV